MNNQKKKSVLFIDQDKKLAEMVASFLYAMNYSVSYSVRIRDALNKMDRQKFDCIILDPDFKKESFEDLLILLSDKSSLNFKTPLIIATFNLNMELSQDLLNLVSLVMPKPYIASKVLAAIEAVSIVEKAS